MYTVFMRVKASSIIAVISIVLYAVAIGTGIIRVVGNIRERRDDARREFYNLTDIASSVGTLGFMEEPFKDAVRDIVLRSKTLHAVIVTGPFGAEFTFERENNGIIAWEEGIPRFQTQFGYSHDPHFAPLRMDGLRNATITAISRDIDYPSLAPILGQSLLIVLAAVLLSVVTLLISALGGKKPAPASEEPQETADLGADTPEAAPVSFTGVVGAGPSRSPPDAVREALDAELGRCIDDDEDLTLLLIDLSPDAGAGIGDDAVVSRTIFGRTRQSFSGGERVVERGDRGLSVILPGINLEDGFAKARQFHSQMLSELPELFPNKADLRIGVSARSGRILGVDRLLLECAKALERAGLDPDSPIVAFKSDPEKYKAFVQKQGRKPTA